MSGSGIPTPGQITPTFPDPSSASLGVTRIPVAGPAPFNTLAFFRLHQSSAGQLLTLGSLSNLLRFRLTQLTPLRINAFNPNRPEQRQFVHSCTAMVWAMSSSDSSTFVIAGDEVAHRDPGGALPVEIAGAAFDDAGHWSVQLDIGLACDADRFEFGLDLRCWVLFIESEPPRPDTAEETLARAQAFAAVQRLAAYRHYITLAGADLWQASQELMPLAVVLAHGSYAFQALEAQQIIVDALRAFTPITPEVRREYPIAFAEARHNLIARLVDVHQVDRAIALLAETVAAYRDYVALPDAQLERAARDLSELSVIITKPAQRPVDAIDAQQLCVDVYARIVPSADGNAEHVVTLAEARHNLIARLLDAARIERVAGDHEQARARIRQASALTDESVAGYREYLRLPNADHTRARRDLTELASLLTAGGLTEQAAIAQRALKEVPDA
jgi:hypothetical protein